MRIFLDANILFSAAKSAGAVHALVSRLLAARYECWVDGYVIDEARRNLVVKAAERLPAFEELVSQLSVSATAAVLARTEPHGLPEKDRVVLAAAVALECDVLLTGDRTHFGRLYGRSLAGVRIHSPRSLYGELFAP
ncbi:MAG: PIN domain-containing protein [Planctomycetia bacterium]|nr:PIN domain-containing protein [Planctomycetia bacterium]